jgi:hypothetical protein
MKSWMSGILSSLNFGYIGSRGTASLQRKGKMAPATEITRAISKSAVSGESICLAG